MAPRPVLLIDLPRCGRAEEHIRVRPVAEIRPQSNDPVVALLIASLELPIVLVRVHGEDQAPLLEVGQAGDGPGLLPHPLQCRHQDRHEQGDDRDHHEQLDQRETRAILRLTIDDLLFWLCESSVQPHRRDATFVSSIGVRLVARAPDPCEVPSVHRRGALATVQPQPIVSDSCHGQSCMSSQPSASSEKSFRLTDRLFTGSAAESSAGDASGQVQFAVAGRRVGQIAHLGFGQRPAVDPHVVDGAFPQAGRPARSWPR